VTISNFAEISPQKSLMLEKGLNLTGYTSFYLGHHVSFLVQCGGDSLNSLHLHHCHTTWAIQKNSPTSDLAIHISENPNTPYTEYITPHDHVEPPKPPNGWFSIPQKTGEGSNGRLEKTTNHEGTSSEIDLKSDFSN